MTVDEKIEKSKYMPVLLDSDDVPLFYIAVCKK